MPKKKVWLDEQTVNWDVKNQTKTTLYMYSLTRVRSHMGFVWIHCTDVGIHCTDILIHCTDILIECK